MRICYRIPSLEPINHSSRICGIWELMGLLYLFDVCNRIDHGLPWDVHFTFSAWAAIFALLQLPTLFYIPFCWLTLTLCKPKIFHFLNKQSIQSVVTTFCGSMMSSAVVSIFLAVLEDTTSYIVIARASTPLWVVMCCGILPTRPIQSSSRYTDR